MPGLDGCGKLDITEMSYDNMVVIGNKVWIKAEVEEKIWIYKDTPCTVIKLNEACYARLCDDLDPIPKGLLAGANFLNMFMDCDGAAGNDNNQPSQADNLESGYQRKARSIDKSLKKGAIEPAKNNVDIRALNAQGWRGMAVIPSAAAIPMKSNISTYGPYASSNFGQSPPFCNGCCGGTQVEVNTDLAPWVFGSVKAMNNAGQTLVESSAVGLVKAETGGITIPGMPISQFSRLGSILGNGGATLSSMNFSYGSGGISTSYEFRTYTPKFGGLGRHLVDRIKDISRNRTEALRFFRNQQIMINKAGRQRGMFNQKLALRDALLNRAPNDRNSLQRLFIGEIYDWQGEGQRTVVGTDKLLDSSAEMVNSFASKSYVSLDYFYGPISKYGDGNLPRYAAYETGCHLTSSDLPQPPYTIDDSPGDSSNNAIENGLDEYNLEITRNYLDPLTNNINENQHHHTGDGRGHVVDLVGKSTKVPDFGLITNFYRLNDADRYANDYRFFALRGPIVLQSWGYDTQGKPIPNEADILKDTKEGKFKSSELKDAFMKDWLAKPASWPVAPIDFRFDRKRGVWVTPPGYRVVIATLDEKLEKYGTAQASLINKDTDNDLEFGPKLYDKDGKEIKATTDEDTEAKIKVVDRIGQSYPSGTKMYCYYDTFKCEYIVIEAAKSYNIRFRLLDICNNGPIIADYGDDWTQHSGYGDKFPNNHILGVRIDCEGNPIDNKGKLINNEDIQEAFNEDANGEKRKQIFINLYDTCGKFGAAYAYYDPNGGQAAFNTWKNKAATGFALLCDPLSENSCALGETQTQCSFINPDYDSYDIVFLDQYARFVECILTQSLYMNAQEVALKFPNDQYKNMQPEGNAAATIQHYYGDPDNGDLPKFYKNAGGLQEIEFRVFDPFKDFPDSSNPFADLTVGDKVLAVFDENRKKYVIYNSLTNQSKVVKFALVQDKNPIQLEAKAILVDETGHPVKKDGKTRIANQNDFNNNIIIVREPYLLPPLGELTVFGPALGSAILNEHLNGIVLSDGYSNKSVNIGPFMGYALKHQAGIDEQQPVNFRTVYEIITLEHFAKYVTGKVGTVTNSFNGYYLGARAGHRQGVIPVGRNHGNLPNHLNVILRHNLQDFIGKHTHLIGDIIDNPTNEGNIIDDVDGCRFIASLDNEVSTTTNLVYDIIECETSALTCSYEIKDQNYANTLNDGKDVKFDDDNYIFGKFMHGFMWDPVKSKQKHYTKTILENGGVDNNDHNTGEIIVGCRGMAQLTSITVNGNLVYTIVTKSEIANVIKRKLGGDNPGLFGCPDFTNDRKINDNYDTFWDGIKPNNIPPNDKPTITIIPTQQWMTYDGSIIIGSWDEYVSPNGKVGPDPNDCHYKIIYAQEAPVIMTTKANKRFEPNDAKGIILSSETGTLLASCQGKDKDPIPDILKNVFNPMGYGAEVGDFVTIQRVFVGTDMQKIEGNHPKCNYKYIVIGTSKPPENNDT